jgi:hypothetical protein
MLPVSIGWSARELENDYVRLEFSDYPDDVAEYGVMAPFLN